MTKMRYSWNEDDVGPSPVRWIGSAKDDLRQLPELVKDKIGQAIWLVQCGDTPTNSKQMHGKLRDVCEIIVDDVSQTIDRVERRLKTAKEHYEQNP